MSALCEVIFTFECIFSSRSYFFFNHPICPLTNMSRQRHEKIWQLNDESQHSIKVDDAEEKVSSSWKPDSPHFILIQLYIGWPVKKYTKYKFEMMFRRKIWKELFEIFNVKKRLCNFLWSPNTWSYVIIIDQLITVMKTIYDCIALRSSFCQIVDTNKNKFWSI